MLITAGPSSLPLGKGVWWGHAYHYLPWWGPIMYLIWLKPE